MASGMGKMHTEHLALKSQVRNLQSTLLNNKTKLASTPEKRTAYLLETVSLQVTPKNDTVLRNNGASCHVVDKKQRKNCLKELISVGVQDIQE